MQRSQHAAVAPREEYAQQNHNLNDVRLLVHDRQGYRRDGGRDREKPCCVKEGAEPVGLAGVEPGNEDRRPGKVET